MFDVLTDDDDAGYISVNRWVDSTWQRVVQWKAHDDHVEALSFVSETELISGSYDGSIRMWDATTGWSVGEVM